MYFITFGPYVLTEVCFDQAGVRLGKMGVDFPIRHADQIPGALLFASKEAAYALLVALSLFGEEFLCFNVGVVEL